MADNEQKIKELEERIANTPYNKATQKAIGQYKAQIAKLKEKQSGGSKGKTEGYSVRKTGDGTVPLLGFPSVGKSTLLNKLTDADSEVGHYAFTTLTVIPGILEYKSAKIQILDVPGIVHGAASGKGRGGEVLSVLRSADLILILLDINYPEHYNALLKEVREAGIRLDTKKPDVQIKKTGKDGIKISSTVKLDIDEETIISILKTFRINNADVLIRSKIGIDELIDCIEDNKVYMPSLVVLNKIDLVSEEELKKIEKKIKPDLKISAHVQEDLEDLKKAIFDKLDLVRIYMKEPGKEADYKEPLIIKRNSSVRNVCTKLHKDFEEKFKFCRIWGPSAKFPGQRQSLKHVLKDEDVLELHIE